MTPKAQAILKKIAIRRLFVAGASFAQLYRRYGRHVVERAIREGCKR